MRKLIIGILCFTALLLAGYSGYRSYATWKQNHLMSMARQFAAESDLRNARLSLSELLRMNPRNVEASRLMADIAERDEMSSAAFWRRRVVELAPQSPNDRLALAAIAVKEHDLKTAADALAGMQEAEKNTAAYHTIAGSLDAAANQLAAAEAHFQQAMRLDPQNPAAELSLAVLRLHDTNAGAMSEARRTLGPSDSNRTNALVRCQAMRELTLDAISHHESDASVASPGNWCKKPIRYSRIGSCGWRRCGRPGTKGSRWNWHPCRVRHKGTRPKSRK